MNGSKGRRGGRYRVKADRATRVEHKGKARFLPSLDWQCQPPIAAFLTLAHLRAISLPTYTFLKWNPGKRHSKSLWPSEDWRLKPHGARLPALKTRADRRCR